VLGEFELTARCNLACAMCYVVDQQAHDLTTETWIDIFDSAVDAGLMYAVLTGGEVFMRDDFAILYNRLYDMGVRITVFTNGTHVPEHIIDVFKKRPPESVTLTVYGASDKTYELVTGKKGAFSRLLNSVGLLSVEEIPFTLRTLPLKPIYDELNYVIEYAKACEVPLFFASYLGPTRQGNFDHATMRLTPEELIDFSNRIRHAFGFDAQQSLSADTKTTTCAALKSAYFINYEGLMTPCAMATKPARSVLDDAILPVFQSLSTMFSDVEAYHGCASCDLKEACMQCYARRLLEGNAEACAPYLKAHATLKGRVKS